MFVVDASVVIELLLQSPRGQACASRLLGERRGLAAPSLLDVEVAQVLRRLDRRRTIDPRRGGEAIADLADLPIRRYPHTLLLRRMWELRKAVSAYDAAYVALAEALNASLLTCDAKLSRTSGLRAVIELI